jgi:hypothetical protein
MRCRAESDHIRITESPVSRQSMAQQLVLVVSAIHAHSLRIVLAVDAPPSDRPIAQVTRASAAFAGLVVL